MLNVFGLLRNTPQQISANFTSRVIANGGSLTTTEQNAVLALVTNLQNNGLWDKIKIIYLDKNQIIIYLDKNQIIYLDQNQLIS